MNKKYVNVVSNQDGRLKIPMINLFYDFVIKSPHLCV